MALVDGTRWETASVSCQELVESVPKVATPAHFAFAELGHFFVSLRKASLAVSTCALAWLGVGDEEAAYQLLCIRHCLNSPGTPKPSSPPHELHHKHELIFKEGL